MNLSQCLVVAPGDHDPYFRLCRSTYPNPVLGPYFIASLSFRIPFTPFTSVPAPHTQLFANPDRILVLDKSFVSLMNDDQRAEVEDGRGARGGEMFRVPIHEADEYEEE